jgi:hypothetical protein
VTCPQCGSTLRAPSRAAAKPAADDESYQEDGQVPAYLKDRILSELGTNERLVWIAQPVSALVFRRSLGYLVGGGLLAALALLWLAAGFLGGSSASAAGQKAGAVPRAQGPHEARGRLSAHQRTNHPVAPPQANTQSVARGTSLVPLILLVVAACCGVVPFYRWKMAQGSCYALTNRRALVFRQGLFGPTRESYSPVEVAQMRRSDSWLFAEGGDLIFRTVTVVRTSYSQRGSSRSVTTTHYGFLAIARVKEVEKLVRETLIDPFADRLQMAGSW